MTIFITYYSVQTLQVKENALKLSSLLNKKKPETIRKLCKLIDIMNKKISSPYVFATLLTQVYQQMFWSNLNKSPQEPTIVATLIAITNKILQWFYKIRCVRFEVVSFAIFQQQQQQNTEMILASAQLQTSFSNI